MGILSVGFQAIDILQVHVYTLIDIDLKSQPTQLIT